jgi:penicillin amidase
MEWWKFKDPTIYHLLKEPLIVFARKGLKVGGNGNIINAITHSHGPSWRMVVNMGTDINAYGVYPGGQNGNPGSRYYDMFVDDWASGNYYQLWFMKPEDKNDKKAKWKMTFTKS